jgi:CheY-like chemotaxis protein
MMMVRCEPPETGLQAKSLSEHTLEFGERPTMTSAPTALLVADDSLLTYVVQRYAASYGAHLTAVDFHAPVVALAAQEQPVVILLNITGVDERGRETLCALRSDPRTCAIPIVLCTAHEIDRHGWAAEVDRVLVQPVMYADFVVILDQATQLVLRASDHPL